MPALRSVLALAILAAAAAPAVAHPHLRVVPEVYDPNGTDAVSSDWRPFDHVGRALVMSKQTATATDAAALAEIEGVDGERLHELGFDVWSGGRCSGGAPRFDVMTTDGTLYFFGCSDGKHTPSPLRHGFERVRFRDADAVPELASDPPWPGFGHAHIASIAIVFDEGNDEGSGVTVLDDIDVNGIIAEHGEGCR